ncbi:2-succinyl-5-enolpyruvyl-6-hydroxy-3-cyclohexene-1-carboxylic-acid synthase [Virgibacillus sp. LDC-1]|uniref:2-succinyl-5-enolpyruvyl-6-hydroxy-3- cyclohexene-1-carboxylic-acid synthase n=1 Tax=Virgibacillus sp. LDC-1 TaxID=3039856 RepID=UPI0024DEA75A|nr:2-succinyl-5-enolpyruvyl-6-hydroxy-3-cyclohexene-1-carboxylic-acid synthase [Virgibacillus sp. LDC-1]
MNHTETLTRYTASFVDELSKSGVQHAVISPGSRSTPLAMTLAEHPKITEWVIIDERSAAFFALGLAKQTKRPVVIVCTSGTAAANYFPAIVEAFYSRVPLVVLTADRPHELRDVGAPQAIEQIKLYGDYVKWFHEMALPEGTPEMLRYARSKASRAVYVASDENSGPVHLNFPFREPLVPDFTLDNLWGAEREACFSSHSTGPKMLTNVQIGELKEQLQYKKRGVIVCGPYDDPALADVLAELSLTWNIPVLVDPLSQMRTGSHDKNNFIEGYDAFLRNEKIRAMVQADFIIRIGAMPISKAFLFYMKEHVQAPQYIIERHSGYREPVGNPAHYIYADPIAVCKAMLQMSIEMEADWLPTWKKMNAIANKHISVSTEEKLTEGDAVRVTIDALDENDTLYVGNSMAIRDVDTFLRATDKKLTVLANRGANGIDGMVSSAVGAAATGTQVTLLLGDLSFYHDLNGLLAAKQYDLNLTIVLINNNGGGIFSFLPQAKDKKHFDLLFGTPLGIDFTHAVHLYGGTHQTVEKEDELSSALYRAQKTEGFSVVEVKTERAQNMKWHRQMWSKIEEEILAVLG